MVCQDVHMAVLGLVQNDNPIDDAGHLEELLGHKDCFTDWLRRWDDERKYLTGLSHQNAFPPSLSRFSFL